jgi:hypothetical protein
MARPEQSTDFNGRLKQATAGPLQKLLAALSAGLLMVMSGCQATTDCGLWRAWADVNSLGGLVAFVDQMRTDGFRTSAPPTVLHDVTAIDLAHSVSEVRSQDFEVIPMADPACDVQQTSHAAPQTVGSGSGPPGPATQPVVKPIGVWLF